jgi:hypothetical protein
MKHILLLGSIALLLVCGPNIAMAFVPGVPPHSGPGSAFYGTEKNPAQKPIPKKKSQEPRSRQVPKQSQ